MKTTFDSLSVTHRALLNAHTGRDGVFVQAALVRALRGNGNAAIYLSDLLWWCKHHAGEDGWFWRRRQDSTKQTGLGADAQRSALRTLKNAGLIEWERRGLPARNHYRLKLEKLSKMLIAAAEPDVGHGPDQGADHAPRKDAGHGPRKAVGDGPPHKGINKGNNKGESAPARGKVDDHPAVKLHQKYWPGLANLFQREQIAAKVDDLDRWRETLDYWKGNGYRGKSVQRQLQKYAESATYSGDGYTGDAPDDATLQMLI